MGNEENVHYIYLLPGSQQGFVQLVDILHDLMNGLLQRLLHLASSGHPQVNITLIIPQALHLLALGDDRVWDGALLSAVDMKGGILDSAKTEPHSLGCFRADVQHLLQLFGITDKEDQVTCIAQDARLTPKEVKCSGASCHCMEELLHCQVEDDGAEQATLLHSRPHGDIAHLTFKIFLKKGGADTVMGMCMM